MSMLYTSKVFTRTYKPIYKRHKILPVMLLFLDMSSGTVFMIDVDITVVLKKFSSEIRLRKFNIPLHNKEGK